MPIALDARKNMPLQTGRWLALVIGNTRLHWGFFDRNNLDGVWHTPHLTAEMVCRLVTHGFMDESWRDIAGLTLDTKQNQLPKQHIEASAVWMASAVSSQTDLWVSCSDLAIQTVLRSHIPLSSLYPTLGIDRAINLLGAGSTIGWPVLVIDAGTALTFTAGIEKEHKGSIYGGAILPGLRLQGQVLGQNTSALAVADEIGRSVSGGGQGVLSPKRWATDTDGAIASGLVYGAIATVTDYLTDWWQRFPAGKVVLTGGDGPRLYTWLKQRTPEIASRVQVDSCLMFRGMQIYRRALTLAS